MCFLVKTGKKKSFFLNIANHYCEISTNFFFWNFIESIASSLIHDAHGLRGKNLFPQKIEEGKTIFFIFFIMQKNREILAGRTISANFSPNVAMPCHQSAQK